MTDEDEPWNEPSMIDPRWTWVAVPFWWLVTFFYWLVDTILRRNE